MNFDNLEVVATANNKPSTGRTGKTGQNYTGISFRRSESKTQGKIIQMFKCSDNIWNRLNLDENGFFQVNDKVNKTVYLGVSPLDETGKLKVKMLRQRENTGRGKSFKSTNLEAALIEAGIMKEGFGKQYFELEEAGEYQGKTMYKVVIAEPIKTVSEDSTEEAGELTTANASSPIADSTSVNAVEEVENVVEDKQDDDLDI